MVTISPQLDAISECIKKSLYSANTSDSRLVATYQITLGLQFRDLLQAVKVLAETRQTSGLWVIIRTLSELYIRSSWMGMDEDRALWTLFGERVDERNRLKEQRQTLINANKPVPEQLDHLIDVISKELTDMGDKVRKSPTYWIDDRSDFKKAPKINFMAIPATAADPKIYEKEEERYEIHTTYFKFGSWYTHGSHRILQDFFEKGSDSPIPEINAFADNEHEYKSALSGVLVLALKFALHLENLGYKVDKQKINEIAASAPKIHDND